MMKKLFLASIILSILFSTIGYAIEIGQDEWTYTLQLEGYHYRYNEKNPDTGGRFLMCNEGMMYGLNFSSEKYMPGTLFDKNWKIAAEIGIAHSDDIKYRSNGTGEADNLYFLRIEPRLLGKIEHSMYWDFYSGLGVRGLHNDFNGISTTGHRGYYRHSLYIYIPLGLVYKFPNLLSDNYKLQSHLEWNFIAYARQYTDLVGGFKNRQKHGYGIRTGLDLIKPDKKLDWIVGIFMRHWAIGDSDIYYGLLERFLEPKNRTFEIGARAGIIF
jgi:hypothetical protein